MNNLFHICCFNSSSCHCFVCCATNVKVSNLFEPSRFKELCLSEKTVSLMTSIFVVDISVSTIIPYDCNKFVMLDQHHPPSLPLIFFISLCRIIILFNLFTSDFLHFSLQNYHSFQSITLRDIRKIIFYPQ